MLIREIGDKITLNRKQEDYPMIMKDWNRHISCQIVFIISHDRYRVRDDFGHEFTIDKEEIK